MRLWTWKFAASLAVMAAFIVDAAWRGPDPFTGRARHFLPYADTGVASFVFLLVVLYVFSHVGQWLHRRLKRWLRVRGEGARG